jgi:hypothetical protein
MFIDIDMSVIGRDGHTEMIAITGLAVKRPERSFFIHNHIKITIAHMYG